MIIDLSMLVNEDTVVFPGDAKPVFEPAGTMATTDFVDNVIHVNNHLGTHIDAPAHMVEGGKMLKDFPIESFIVSALCIDARGRDLLDVDLVETVDLRQAQAVLFYTGMGDDYTDQAYATDYPKISLGLADALVEMKMTMVGVDMISYDHDEPFPVHKRLLKEDILLIENLTNLDKLVGRIFKLYALPVNFDLEAAPARVVAELSD